MAEPRTDDGREEPIRATNDEPATSETEREQEDEHPLEADSPTRTTRARTDRGSTLHPPNP